MSAFGDLDRRVEAAESTENTGKSQHGGTEDTETHGAYFARFQSRAGPRPASGGRENDERKPRGDLGRLAFVVLSSTYRAKRGATAADRLKRNSVRLCALCVSAFSSASLRLALRLCV